MAKSICESCGTVGSPVTITPGSIFIELFLWLLFLLPGLLYSVWRLAARRTGCPTCKGQMIPLTTPRGRALAETYGHQS